MLENALTFSGEGSPSYVEVVDGIRSGETAVSPDRNEYKTKDKLKIK